MELVTDTNCLISALIISGRSRELICSPKLSLFAPEEIIEETESHKEEILSKSGISELDFSLLINVFLSNIKIIPEEEFKQFKEKALSLASHPEDSPFIALALAKRIPIWSDDKALKKQSEVKVISTTELIGLME